MEDKKDVAPKNSLLQLDSRGYVKGTNTLYKSKCVVLRRFSSRGVIKFPGDIMELEGGALISCLSANMVRLYDPAIDDKKETASDSTMTAIEKPRRKRKKKTENKEQ